MTYSPELTLKKVKELIRSQLAQTEKGLRTWGTLDYVLLFVGIASPLVAAFLGGKAVVEFESTQQSPSGGWARTCGLITLIALIGGLANALHKGFNMAQKHSDLSIRKTRLTQLEIGCSPNANLEQLQKKLIRVVGGE